MKRVQQIRALSRSHVSRRAMSTMAAYILPHEPNVSSAQVTEVDPAKLLSTIPGKETKVGTTRVFYNTPADKVTVLASLGEKFASKTPNEKRELVRRAVGSAVRQAKGIDGIDRADIDATADPHAAGVSLVSSDTSTSFIDRQSSCWGIPLPV
jgi:aminopeptidase